MHRGMNLDAFIITIHKYQLKVKKRLKYELKNYNPYRRKNSGSILGTGLGSEFGQYHMGNLGNKITINKQDYIKLTAVQQRE